MISDDAALQVRAGRFFDSSDSDNRSPRGASERMTLAEELRLQLADDIICGALAPGAALDESDIARRFNVSRTPVRGARGAVVARPTVERLNGMFEAMAELESLCAGLAAERMPAEATTGRIA